MTHNPIKTIQKVGTLSSFTADLHTFGVVFAGKRYNKVTLKPGDKVRAGLRELTIHVVDAKTHDMTLQLDVPCNGEDDDDYFRTSVLVRYKIVDPLYMVNEGIADTEVLARDVMKQRLRQKAGEFRLNQYRQVSAAFSVAVASANWESCGLMCVGTPEATIELSKPQSEKIRLLKGRHTRPHKLSLPSKDPLFAFQVTVGVTYAMDDPDLLTDPLEEAEMQLFRQHCEGPLRRTCQQYDVDQVNQAEAALLETMNTLINAGLQDFGVRISLASVSAGLDDATLARKKDLQAERRKLIGSHSRTHKLSLPTKEPLYRFQVTVNVIYQVDEPDLLKDGNLDEAQTQLFQKSSEKALREVCQEHQVDELNLANVAMQKKLNAKLKTGLQGFGVRITSMNVLTELDEPARLRREELATVHHQNDVRAAKNEIASRDYEALQGTAIGGAMALRLLAVARGEMQLTDLIAEISATEKEMYARQLEIWVKTRESDNPLFAGIDNNLLINITRELVNTATPPPAMLPGERKGLKEGDASDESKD
jgi:hypothetical protein